jgi:hypothetical protein
VGLTAGNKTLFFFIHCYSLFPSINAPSISAYLWLFSSGLKSRDFGEVCPEFITVFCSRISLIWAIPQLAKVAHFKMSEKF